MRLALCRQYRAWIHFQTDAVGGSRIDREQTNGKVCCVKVERCHANIVRVVKAQNVFLELFRNNILDVGIDPWPYGTHSFRRGGCQWLAYGMRWSLQKICAWGGWSMDLSNATIFKYLCTSWNDKPLERREDLLDPRRAPAVTCFTCGRSCNCGW